MQAPPIQEHSEEPDVRQWRPMVIELNGTARPGQAPRVEHTGAVNGRTRVPTRRSFGLRARVTLFFSIAGLISSVALAAVTFIVARNYLLDQRQSVAQSQTLVNARGVRDELRTRRDEANAVVQAVRTDGSSGFAILHLDEDDRYFAQPGVRVNQDVIPTDLRANVQAGGAGSQRAELDGEPYLVVGVPIADAEAQYFEGFPLSDVERTLRLIATSVAIGAAISTFMAACIGWWASRRLLRPLSRVADVATKLASGGLDTRLPPEDDPDLDRVAQSFNDMADAMQARIHREAQFASDVSHELRSPITALTAAVEVLDARRADLSDRSQQALDVVVSQVRRFDQLVLDLLELSRLDAGAPDLHLEEVSLPDVVRRIASRYGFGDVPIEAGPGADRPIRIDKRRLERIVANLLDNARQHGGGPLRMTLNSIAGQNGDEPAIELAVEDAGPGVAMSERNRIFERFARGTAARHRIGTGLGLALVAEHAQSHGGRAWVDDRPGGGSRFVVSFPAGDR